MAEAASSSICPESGSGPLHIPLAKCNVRDIANELLTVAYNWAVVGTCLGVDEPEIKEIETQRLLPKRALIELITRWLSTNHNVTWNDIVRALRMALLNEESLAKKIEEKALSRTLFKSVSSPSQVEEESSSMNYLRSESSPALVQSTSSAPLSSTSSQQPDSSCSPSVSSNTPIQEEGSDQPSVCDTSIPNRSQSSNQLLPTASQTKEKDHPSKELSTEEGQAKVSPESKVLTQATKSPTASSHAPHSSDPDEWPSVDKSIESRTTSLSKTSSSSTSSQSIQLECEVFNGSNKRQIQCSMVSNKEVPPRYRDIKIKVKKFDTIPPYTPIFFRVRASETCYVYIINKGSSGGLTTLIPNECDQNNCLERPEHFIQYPPSRADYEFELDQNCGTETIVVLAYSHAISDANQAEKDCEEILSEEKKEVFPDIKVVNKTSSHSICRGCIEVQFTVK